MKTPAAALALLREPKTARVMAALDGRGEEARIVGGALRNALMGLPVADVDFAVTAEPAEIVARAEAAGLKAVPTGIDHGTITLVVEGAPFEVTTLREDVATDGRRAIVRYGRDFDADARRRDFTMNALSLSADGVLHDPVGGLPDLEARRVRFIGDPDARIAEDYLRVLRFFRFHAAYGEGGFDRPGFAACVRGRDGLSRLSRERVRAELLKLLVARCAAEAVRDIAQAGLLGPLFAGAPTPARLAALARVEAALGQPPDAVLRLAALAVLVSEDAGRLRDMLRLSNAEAARLEKAAAALVCWHGRLAPPRAGELRHKLFEQGQRVARDAALLAHAESGAPADDPAWASAHAFLRDTPELRLPFSGADLMARGLPPGSQIGRVLKDLQARWIRAGFSRDANVLARLLDEALEQAN
jgi:poly(A) polymerase